MRRLVSKMRSSVSAIIVVFLLNATIYAVRLPAEVPCFAITRQWSTETTGNKILQLIVNNAAVPIETEFKVEFTFLSPVKIREIPLTIRVSKKTNKTVYSDTIELNASEMNVSGSTKFEWNFSLVDANLTMYQELRYSFNFTGMEYDANYFRAPNVTINNNKPCLAASCVKNSEFTRQPGEILVNMGRVEILRFHDEGFGEVRGLSQIIIHPEWDISETHGNIAVLVFSRPVKYNPRLRPVCVKSMSHFEGEGTLVGWPLDARGHLVFKQHAALLRTLTPVPCKANYPRLENIVTNNTFCAGTKEDPLSVPCYGSGAGGLYTRFLRHRNSEETFFHLSGILSRVLPSAEEPGLCDKTQYKVFINTSKYFDWLVSVTGIYFD
ncbi:hypothetical protein B566_EDAN007412 [Ephemera danica]|nr:hypothetical protein B566_EDAN007412 [Ephemera danica]